MLSLKAQVVLAKLEKGIDKVTGSDITDIRDVAAKLLGIQTAIICELVSDTEEQAFEFKREFDKLMNRSISRLGGDDDD